MPLGSEASCLELARMIATTNAAKWRLAGAVSGILWMNSGLRFSSFAYDASEHTLFLGFVMSMIMAHAPIVILRSPALRSRSPQHSGCH